MLCVFYEAIRSMADMTGAGSSTQFRPPWLRLREGRRRRGASSTHVLFLKNPGGGGLTTEHAALPPNEPNPPDSNLGNNGGFCARAFKLQRTDRAALMTNHARAKET